MSIEDFSRCTADLVDLRREVEFQVYAKVGKGGTNFANTVVRAPEGATLYIERRELFRSEYLLCVL